MALPRDDTGLLMPAGAPILDGACVGWETAIRKAPTCATRCCRSCYPLNTPL
jgi:hypothetical protein